MDPSLSNDINLLHLSIAFISSIAGGFLIALFGLPVKIITASLKKKTLWEFENMWLFVSIVGFLIIPLLSIPVLVPFSGLSKLFSEGVVLNVEWIVPIIVVIVWLSFGLMMLCHAIQKVGLGTAFSLSLTVSIVTSTAFKWIWASSAVLQDATGVIREWSYAKLVLFLVAILILIVGSILTLISSVLLERSTREVRLEFEVGIRHDVVMDRSRFETKDNKAKLEKLQRKVTPETMITQFWFGVCTAIISGVFLPFIQFAVITPRGLITSFMTEAGLNIFQAEAFILGLSLPIASIFSLLICLTFLIFNKSIKKYALCSGGLIALDGCTNFKGWRLAAAIVSSMMGVIGYFSFLLLIIGDWMLSSARSSSAVLHVPNLHYSLWCATALIVGNICGVILEVVNRQRFRVTGRAERIIGPISIVVLALGFIFMSVATFPGNPIVV